MDIPQPEDFGLPAGIFDNPPAELSLDRFCFIPTISALEIGPFRGFTSTFADLYTDVSDNDAVIASGQTLVTRYVAVDDDPDPTSDLENNQAHPGFSFDNTGVILTEILNGSGFSSPLLARTYNFGKANIEYDYRAVPAPGFTISQTPIAIDEDKVIGSGGEVWVNRTGTIGYTDVSSNASNEVSQFELFIRKGCEPQTSVTISNTARMELGQWDAAAGITNTAQVYVQEDAQLSVQYGGEVQINKSSALRTQEGGRLEVASGGAVVARFGGELIVESGGELRIEAGATLQVSQYARCVIEEGGRLILEDGAFVLLDDWEDPEGRAVVEVSGELVVGGEIIYAGNGFFDFYPSHTLTLNNGEFHLSGNGFGQRFIKLQPQTALQIGSGNLQLSKGRVEYGSGSSIQVDGGSAVLTDMELMSAGGTATALWAQQADRIVVANSFIGGMFAGVEAYQVAAANPLDLLFLNTTFKGNTNGLMLDGGQEARIWQCDFAPDQAGAQAIAVANFQSVRMEGCGVQEYLKPAVPGAEEAWGAIYLENIGEYIMTGGAVADNDVGFYCPAGATANLTLRGQAEVSGHAYYGIHIVEGSREGANSGLITMDCARLLDNGVAGIKGRNLILNIDAYINSQTTDPAFVRANHFQRGPNDALWFDICYDGPLAESINTIPASGNYWGTDHANPEPGGGLFYYSLDKVSFGGCGGFPEIGLDFGALHPSGAPVSCPAPAPTGPDVPVSKDCRLVASPTESIKESYHQAFEAYQLKLALDEETLSTYAVFTDVASQPNTSRNMGTDVCKHYVDVARVFSPYTLGQQMQSADVQQGRAVGQKSGPMARGLLVSPNPVQESLHLTWAGTAPCHAVVYNSLGQLVWTGILPVGQTAITTESWAAGWYVLRALPEGQPAIHLRLSVQH